MYYQYKVISTKCAISILFWNKVAKMLPNWSLRYRNLAFQVNSLRAWETWFCIGMRTAEKFCLFPVEWEDCTRSVKYGTNRVKNAIWYCALAYLMMDTGYQMVNIFTLNYHTTPVDDIIKLLLHGLTRLAACGLIYGFLENYESSMRLFNQICRIHRKLKGDSVLLNCVLKS